MYNLLGQVSSKERWRVVDAVCLPGSQTGRGGPVLSHPSCSLCRRSGGCCRHVLLLFIVQTTCQFFKHLAFRGVRGATDSLSWKEAKPGVLAESCAGPARLRGDTTAQLDYSFSVCKAEILEELPKLTPAERQEVRLKLAALDGAQWIDAADPLTDAEKALLDARLAAYEEHSDVGSSWEEVEARIRARLKA